MLAPVHCSCGRWRTGLGLSFVGEVQDKMGGGSHLLMYGHAVSNIKRAGPAVWLRKGRSYETRSCPLERVFKSASFVPMESIRRRPLQPTTATPLVINPRFFSIMDRFHRVVPPLGKTMFHSFTSSRSLHFGRIRSSCSPIRPWLPSLQSRARR